MLRYPFDFPRLKGCFIRRVNRFVLEAQVEDKKVQAYLPNPGRLWELLLPGRELLLAPNLSQGKLPYTVLACLGKHGPILLHTQLTNRIVQALIEDKRFAAYTSYKVARREPALGRHRFDLLLQHRDSGEELFLEIKSCTLFADQLAMFPDAVTTRGADHLVKLAELSREGRRSSCLFVVMNPQARFFLPAYHVDPRFTNAFLEVRKEVDLQAVALDFDRAYRTVRTINPLVIPESLLEHEVGDRGVYLLIISLNHKTTLSVGALGQLSFDAGFYIYVGSARKGLARRLSRHKARRKKKHWHIDYLAAQASSITTVPIVTPEDLECQLSQQLHQLSDHTVSGFGSSDCRCRGHLFPWPGNPLADERFIKMLQYYRLGRLEEKLSPAEQTQPSSR